MLNTIEQNNAIDFDYAVAHQWDYLPDMRLPCPCGCGVLWGRKMEKVNGEWVIYPETKESLQELVNHTGPVPHPKKIYPPDTIGI